MTATPYVEPTQAELTGGRAIPAKLQNIQALRAVAAYLVVFHHVIDSWNNYTGKIYALPINLNMGATGVDLFFVISGFIMIQTTNSGRVTPFQFFGKRVARVVPLYWLLTLATVLGVALGGKLFGNTEVDAGRILHALFFIPEFNAQGEVLPPILFVGWTLNYEMFFYVIFTGQLAFGIPGARNFFVPVVFGMIAAVAYLNPNPHLGFYANSIVWEFVAGMLIAQYFQRGSCSLGVASGWACVGIGAILLAMNALLDGSVIVSWRGLVSGLPAALIVFGALVLDMFNRRILGGWWQRQGDASYSLYLVHPFVLQFLGKLMIVTSANLTLAGIGIGYTIMFAATALAGTAIYRWVEEPLSWHARSLALYFTGAPERTS